MPDLRDELRDAAVAAVGDALAGASTCGLADFPRHTNVGDCAIWLGERKILSQLGVRVRAACDSTTYRARGFRRRLGDGPVLIHGGGNFGGLYHGPQAFRERILREYADRPIVQLPQTVNFVDRENLDATGALIAAHGNVTLMVRDHASARQAAELGARVVLAPDAAFALGARRRPVRPRQAVVQLARTDDEQALGGGATLGEHLDWLETRGWSERLAGEWHKLELGIAAGRLEGGGGWLPALAPVAYDRYAMWNVRRGSRLLSRGRVVVTDRLHAHILCSLMGIPHVLLDDRHHKVRRFWDAWTSGIPFARFARDADEARILAGSLVAA